jgi:hypothetical protein
VSREEGAFAGHREKTGAADARAMTSDNSFEWFVRFDFVKRQIDEL